MGVAPHRARQIVEIAERVELPVCVAAFRRGELAVDQMAAIAKRAPWWTDAEICRLGQATVRQLRDTLAQYPFPDYPRPGEEPEPVVADAVGPVDDSADPVDDSAGPVDDSAGPVDDSADPADGAEGRCAPEPADRCWFYFDDDGRFHLDVQTDHLTGKVIESALVEARDRLFHDGHPDVTWTDAPRDVADRSSGAIDDPARRNRFRIDIHIGMAGRAVDATGWRLPDAIRRHVTCDGLLSPVFVEGAPPATRSPRPGPDPRPLGPRRRRRSARTATRRASASTDVGSTSTRRPDDSQSSRRLGSATTRRHRADPRLRRRDDVAGVRAGRHRRGAAGRLSGQIDGGSFAGELSIAGPAIPFTAVGGDVASSLEPSESGRGRRGTGRRRPTSNRA